MLIKLYVQNYVFIRELDLSLNKGLTVITGETGAGKSILLGALSLILGARADVSALLDKSSKCVVEGTFRIKGYGLEEFFRKNDLDYDDNTIIRREINPAGKSRAFINDIPVTLNILKELGDRLIDIHSQHENLMLNENIFQLNVIDSFAGNMALRNEYRKIYNEYRRLEKEYNELKEKSEKNQSDLEYYQFQLNQLLEAKIVPGEQEELEKEQELLEHAEEIKASLNMVVSLLSSEEASVLGMLAEVKQLMGKLRSYLPAADTLAERVNSAYIELDDILSETEKLIAGISGDPERLKVVNERLDLLNSLVHKHRVKNSDELIIRTGELKKLVSSIVSSDERLEQLEKEIAKKYEEMKLLGEQLSGKRKEVIPEMEQKITSMLRQLGMPHARFRVELSKMPAWSSTGNDRADFLFSANREVPPENITKVASGGELSRVMLSLKSMLSSAGNLPTIIFDEIDAGVSGEVADRVGKILAEMGKNMQVINITHLPQVAARGQTHFHVFKDDTGKTTVTRIKLLRDDERVMEIAKLLSGSEVTETAVKNARELLNAAAN
ncbi:MAG: DNA repair protein RecN [Bacteroidales bacterium]